MKALSYTLFGIGAVLLTIVGAEAGITSRCHLPIWVFTVFTYVGAGTLVVAVVLWLCSQVSDAVGWEVEYQSARVKRSELKHLHKFLSSLLGPDILSERKMREFYDRNSGIFNGLYRVMSKAGRTRSTLVGHFSVGGITTEAKKLLLEDKLKGTAFTSAHLCTTKQTPAGFYIGAVAANGRTASAETLIALFELPGQCTNQNSRLVFTRPTTQDGLRLVKKHNFHPVLPGADETLNITYVRDFFEHKVTKNRIRPRKPRKLDENRVQSPATQSLSSINPAINPIGDVRD